MKSIKNWYFYKLFVAKLQKFKVKRNPQSEMCRWYYAVYKKYPNLENPSNLIEVIYWLLLNTDTSMWSRCADKYAMRSYVEECGLGEFLPKNLGKWDKADDIDFDKLPDQFVLKANNGCGTVLIVKDKSTIDENKIKKKMKQWLNVPFGWSGAELHYTQIKPCIIAEELLFQDEEQKVYSPNSQVDFKVWCINGEPENVLVVFNRSDAGYSLDLYDTKWERMTDKMKKNGHYILRDEAIPRPKSLDDMLSIAKKLAAPFPEVRVDFYEVNGKPVIGELTFTTGFGYFSDAYYEYLGKKVDLTKVKRN